MKNPDLSARAGQHDSSAVCNDSQEQYVAALFPNGALIDLHAYRNHRVGPRCFARGIAEATEFIAEHSTQWDVYVGVAARSTTRGGKQDLAYAAAVWADVDPAQVEQARQRAKDLPPASMVVGSGRGYHLYWLLDEPYDLTSPASIATFESITRGIKQHLGADNAHAANKVLRPPGTLNHKEGGPYQVTLLRTRRARYALDTFAPFAAAGEAGRRPTKRAKGQVLAVVAGNITPNRHAAPPVPLTTQLDWFQWSNANVRDRSHHLFTIGCGLARAGANVDVIAQALAERDVSLGFYKFAARPWYYLRTAEDAVSAVGVRRG